MKDKHLLFKRQFPDHRGGVRTPEPRTRYPALLRVFPDFFEKGAL